MKEKDGRLIESLRKRRDEYCIPLRKESWEKLERELLLRSAFRRRTYRCLCVAAAMLVCLVLSLPFIMKKDTPGVVDNTPGNRTEKTAPHKENASPVQEQQTIVAVASTASPILHELPAEEETVIEEEETEKPEIISFTGPQQEKRSNINYAPPVNKNKRQSKWVFGLSAGSNNPKSSLLEQIDKEPGVSAPEIVDPPYTAPDDDTTIGSAGLEGEGESGDEEEGEKPGSKAYAPLQARSRREITRYNYRHRPPISIGISVQKTLSHHFGLESGLTYTYLYSEISEQRASGYIGNQTLHYLGIPLKAYWLLYNRKRFSIYLSGGALFEYCISANRKIGNQKDALDLNRFQASLNAAAGMQIALTKPLSVFIEPGVSYFSDNGSGVETIRTDNLLLFNLQAGIRLTY